MNQNNSTPFTVGQKDLDPLAAAPGIAGTRAGIDSQGGMVMTAEHPLFRPHQPTGFTQTPSAVNSPFLPTNPRPSLPYPSIGPNPAHDPLSLPQGAVPIGARFDPITPFGPRPGFTRPSRGPFGGMPFGGDPDNVIPLLNTG
jgi:proteasome inhibitor subunit 1 (PI31)